MPNPSQQRRLPFLHRNWAAGIAAFQEWAPAKTTATTTTTTTTTTTAFRRARTEDAGATRDEYVHPAKRRRIGSPPNDAASDSRNPRGALDALRLPDDPDARTHDLRVQVFHVLHKDTPRLRFSSNATARVPAADTTALGTRIKISLLSEQCGLPLLLCCAAQVGTVHTDGDASSPRGRGSARGIARLAVEPLVVPLEQMATVDPETGVFGLAGQYRMRIEIESTASNAAAWPPVGLLPRSRSAAASPAATTVAQHPAGKRDHGPRTMTAGGTGGRFTKTLDTAAKLAKLPTPPPPLPPSPTPPRSELCILYAEASDIFARPRMRIPLWLRESPKHEPVRTDYVLDVGVRWSTGFVERPPTTLHLGVLPSIVALHPDEPLPPPSALGVSDFPPWRRRRRQQQDRAGRGGSASHTMQKTALSNGVVEDSEDADDDLGSSDRDSPAARSLRERRRQTDYNLRTVPDRSAGVQEARKHPPLTRTAPSNGHQRRSAVRVRGADTATAMALDETSTPVEKVSFVYPPEELIVNGFVCCMCMAASPDIVQLRAHLMVHWKYHFALDVRPASSGSGGGNAGDGDGGGSVPDDAVSGCRYFFSVSRVHDADSDGDSGRPLRPAVFQLGRPTRPLDLARYVDGDRSWVAERYGPQHGEEAVLPMHAKSKTKPPLSKSGQRARNKKNRLLVPHTRQKLFDPLSKALLVPGTVLRQPAVAVDDSWRIHKHREIVQDYTDLTPAEKEFIQEWDRFLIVHRIASDAYIPAALVQFVQEHGAWLMADRARSMEFGKLMAVLLARDVLSDDADVDRITKALNAARHAAAAAAAAAADKTEAARKEAPPPDPPRRDPFGCTLCGRRCSGPEMLICCNSDCTRRLWHRSCLGDTAIVGPQYRHEWYCNACAHLAYPGHLVRPLAGGADGRDGRG